MPQDLPQLPPPFRLVALESVGSTNDRARALAESGALEGTLVWAKEQLKGRGRQGRTWYSPPGNLYLSLILRPDIPLARAPEFGFVVATALAEAAKSVLPPFVAVTCKWPNDLLLNGKKAGGILLESNANSNGHVDWLVAGMGINVTRVPDQSRFPPTSLRACGAEVDVPEFLSVLAHALAGFWTIWSKEGFAPIRRAWWSRAWKRGEAVDLDLGHETISGRFARVDATGAMVLETAGQERTITTADVMVG